MKKHSYLLLLGLSTALLLLAACSSTQQAALPQQPKNIILLIGDGMGLTQASTAFYYQEKTPSFERFKHIGLHKPKPRGAQISDSAAGATAFASGVKSYNGAIGVDEDTVAKETILEIAARRGQRTGLIATSSITHATPACFFAHVPKRSMQEEIAEQLVSAPVHFFAGGGLKFFTQREDGRNLLADLANEGFALDTAQLSKPSAWKADGKYAYLLAEDGMPKMQDGRGDFLPQATQMALDMLSQSPEGFFLMVEGSQIDWGGHANDADYLIAETLDFDKTIDVALDFAERDGNTLVIVTADHECGGLSLSSAEVRRQRNYEHINPTFSTGGHSATLIPVYAYGPGAELFAGIYENNSIFAKMLAALRWPL